MNDVFPEAAVIAVTTVAVRCIMAVAILNQQDIDAILLIVLTSKINLLVINAFANESTDWPRIMTRSEYSRIYLGMAHI